MVEAAKIAARRADLVAKIIRETVPLLLAQSGYQRSDGLIRDINAVFAHGSRIRLLNKGPSPLDPNLWLEAWRDIAHFSTRLIGEVRNTFAQETSPASLAQKAPFALLIAGLGIWMLLGVRRSFADLVERGLSWAVKLRSGSPPSRILPAC